jgi:hypothetical protein
LRLAGLIFRRFAFRQNSAPYAAAAYMSVFVELGSWLSVLADSGSGAPYGFPIPKLPALKER